jgi:hypothetical protein
MRRFSRKVFQPNPPLPLRNNVKHLCILALQPASSQSMNAIPIRRSMRHSTVPSRDIICKSTPLAPNSVGEDTFTCSSQPIDGKRATASSYMYSTLAPDYNKTLQLDSLECCKKTVSVDARMGDTSDDIHVPQSTISGLHMDASSDDVHRRIAIAIASPSHNIPTRNRSPGPVYRATTCNADGGAQKNTEKGV